MSGGRRVVVTGGAGFVGGALVRALASGGDRVVALVRDPANTGSLDPATVDLVASDLSDVATLTAAVRGADAVIHAAGSYRVGIPASERPAMLDANRGATERVLDAAIKAGVPRIAYVSTVNVFGNTRGRVVDETFRRDPADGFLSYYDESKWLAHLAAEARIASGAPIVIVQPSQVYGPSDHSPVGQQFRGAAAGTLPFLGLGGTGMGLVHVDDLATGIVAALDRGSSGRSYVLSGPTTTFHDALEIAARVGGHRLPRLSFPDAILSFGATLFPNQGAWFGLSPNLKEIVSASIRVTYWASSARAKAELGFEPRDIETGFADAFGAGGG